ncbi:COX assembly mitochondrial protein homolog isoform X1 [Tiliqua scincoides]|uniref:COX assembly mitochondrial protein homolog isoform X1 n=1 Tax=Tiliqua scincoides TaxID=71010 RepID=UPI00346355D5
MEPTQGAEEDPKLRHVEKDVLIPKMMREKARELCSDKVQGGSNKMTRVMDSWMALSCLSLQCETRKGNCASLSTQYMSADYSLIVESLYKMLSRYRPSDGGQMSRGKCSTERMSHWLLYRSNIL